MHTVQFLVQKNVFAIATLYLKHSKIVLGLNVITLFDI